MAIIDSNHKTPIRSDGILATCPNRAHTTHCGLSWTTTILFTLHPPIQTPPLVGGASFYFPIIDGTDGKPGQNTAAMNAGLHKHTLLLKAR